MSPTPKTPHYWAGVLKNASAVPQDDPSFVRAQLAIVEAKRNLQAQVGRSDTWQDSPAAGANDFIQGKEMKEALDPGGFATFANEAALGVPSLFGGSGETGGTESVMGTGDSNNVPMQRPEVLSAGDAGMDEHTMAGWLGRLLPLDAAASGVMSLGKGMLKGSMKDAGTGPITAVGRSMAERSEAKHEARRGVKLQNQDLEAKIADRAAKGASAPAREAALLERTKAATDASKASAKRSVAQTERAEAQTARDRLLSPLDAVGKSTENAVKRGTAADRIRKVTAEADKLALQNKRLQQIIDEFAQRQAAVDPGDAYLQQMRASLGGNP